ncbi:hypothetical protein [Capillimicrobium parvum]|uniref:Methionine synthase n=1 Tax=Capillimicrobium parvum TaxID=2884022 RepID=A0A9E6XX56_9ACTN|nr:hypothetical protein [Capillimicrobium parvum]UGS36144.1 hypothetical protein DSM104329_02544 [Capillimicrobium parvum]
MAPRVSSELLLVGSLPAASTEEALRVGGELYGDLVFALPDGETGPRALWAAYDHMTMLEPNEGIEVVEPGAVPPRHVEQITVLGVRDGIGVGELTFDRWPRLDDAIASYEVFRRLRDEGAIPAHVRFQVGLPFNTSVMASFKRDWEHDFAVVSAAYEEMFSREIRRLTDAIPPEDLVIQWDVCWEVLNIEGVISWMEGDAWKRFAGGVTRLTRMIPEQVLVGYHLCYGTFPAWPMYEARDMSLLVKMANYAVQESGRPVDFLHLAGPRDLRSEDSRFFAPLADLDTPDTRLYLGIVLPVDGVDGLRRRHATASQYLDDFGVAMYCGFGRQPGQDGMETMREHRRVVAEVLAAPSN